MDLVAAVLIGRLKCDGYVVFVVNDINNFDIRNFSPPGSRGGVSIEGNAVLELYPSEFAFM